MSRVSVVIRTYNEQQYLGELMQGIARQDLGGLELEVVLVDSGSTDRTLEIAAGFGARVVEIRKEDFTFGRSLNIGCEAATGDVLVFVSGHCIPVDSHWIARLVAPLIDGRASYAYGKQVGWGSSKFSECQLFRKYYPEFDKLQEDDFFCNNANAALLRRVWQDYRFDETLTGLEDMELAQRLVRDRHRIAYVAGAPVHHIHEEIWSRVKTRYEREAVALQRIMPQVYVGFGDFLRYFVSAVFFDVSVALQERKLLSSLGEIVMFRFCQFWGSYKGSHDHRRLSNETKERYFYPK